MGETDYQLADFQDQVKRYQSFFELFPDAIVAIDENGWIVDANPSVQSITGYTIEETVQSSFYKLWSETDLPLIRKQLDGCNLEVIELECTLIQKDGGRTLVNLLLLPIHIDQRRTGVYGVIRYSNALEMNEAEKLLHHMAFHDSLTDLPNRQFFKDQLLQALDLSKKTRGSLAILFIDLDRFKLINDSLGHSVGDRVLQEAANRIQNSVRAGDFVARLGGDEFTVLLPVIEEESGAAKVAESILHAFSEPLRIEEERYFYLTPSIGIACYPGDGDTMLALMQNADAAMYAAKERGKNNFQLYSRGLHEETKQKLKLENELRTAVKEKQFLVYYQPQVDTRSGDMIGMEALVRWQHPERGLLTPSHFVPLAEESSLIVLIGELVLEIACLQNKQWQDQGLPAIPVSVNLSIHQLEQSDFITRVQSILDRTQLHPSFLELEITESMAIRHTDPILPKLRELVDMGIRISIDDFGTGYSSLSYLMKFPVQTLKIDRSFVKEMARDTDHAAIVSAIISMAHSLHLKVIAEGVETEDQLHLLKEGNCNEVQGFLFSTPVPSDRLEELLQKNSVSLKK